ncbi:MAG: 6-pyruvoyl-tetrahydropterin synthase-related protein [Acidobacteriota bacterium]
MEIRTPIQLTTTARPRDSHETRARLMVAIACLLFSAFTVVPFFFMGVSPAEDAFELRMPVTHDMHLHYDQMKSFHEGLKAGHLYPRWEEDTNRGFGAPTTSYYPPAIYYLTSFFYSVAGDWTRSLLLTHLLLMIASGAGIYLCARRAMSRSAAAAAMIAYITLPYHLIDQYHRAALAELLGFVWMPLILLFADQLIRSPDQEGTRSRFSRWLTGGAGLAASIGAFAWSHPPTAYQFFLAFGLAAIALSCARRDAKGLVIATIAGALGLALAAAYLYPAAVEQDFIRHEYVSESWPYHGSYVFVHALPYAQHHRGFFNMIDAAWIFGAIIIALGALAVFGRKTRSLSERVLMWATVGAFASFMMTKFSYPLGRLIPKIDIGVFTWRMLSITTLASALIAGACWEVWRNEESRRWQKILSGSIVAFVLIVGTLFSIGANIAAQLRAPAFVPEAEHFNDAMIPRAAPSNPRELPSVERAELASGSGEISIELWEPQRRVIRADLTSDDRLMIRAFNFPGWTATVDGQSVAISEGEALRLESGDGKQRLVRALTHKDDEARVVGREPLGDMVIDLAAGSHLIELRYTGTAAQRAGGRITAISFAFLIAAAIVGFIIRPRVRLMLDTARRVEENALTTR